MRKKHEEVGAAAVRTTLGGANNGAAGRRATQWRLLGPGSGQNRAGPRQGAEGRSQLHDTSDKAAPYPKQSFVTGVQLDVLFWFLWNQINFKGRKCSSALLPHHFRP